MVGVVGSNPIVPTKYQKGPPTSGPFWYLAGIYRVKPLAKLRQRFTSIRERSPEEFEKVPRIFQLVRLSVNSGLQACH